MLLAAFVAASPDARAQSAPSIDDLRSAFASQQPPKLDWRTQSELTITVTRTQDQIDAAGRCRRGRPVVISGKGAPEPARVECATGSYTARIAGSAPPAEIVASQVLLDGTIIAARYIPAVTPRRQQRIGPKDLAAALASAEPGDRIILEPGTYADVKVDLTTQAGGAPGAPIMIDGGNAVTFTGATQIKLGARHLVLRGLKFQYAAASTILISGPDARVTESEFMGCGDPARPQAECILILADGARAELDFNTFVASLSMSIKVRAGADDAPVQPIDVSVHHNVFRDIAPRSSNGQEVVQVAGPGGGGSNAPLRTRIEHNLFFRAQGDREAISMKAPGVLVRWNAFRDMDASPNFRGSPDNVMAENVLIRTRPVRVAGRNNQMVGNILICPNGGYGIVISHGTPGYEVAANNLISHNTVAITKKGVLFAAQTLPLETVAFGNQIVDNTFHQTRSGSVYEMRPEDVTVAITSDNTLAGTGSGQKLCP